MSVFDRLVHFGSVSGRRVDTMLPRSPFGRLGVTHAGGSAADALVSLALAGSLFFSLEPNAAKSKVLQYLLISLAPFVVVAPFIGPLVDRLGHARRWVLFGSLMARAVVALFMAGHLDSLFLFPEAFAVLVAAKTAAVARNALVPAVVPSEQELVRANARLSLISVFGGAMLLPVGLIIRKTADDGWVLVFASLVFVLAALSSLRIKVRRTGHADGDSVDRFAKVVADAGAVRVNAFAMAILRGAVGCVMFLSLFSLRAEPLWVMGLTLGSLSGGSSVGAAIAERLRARTTESRMILGSLITVAGVAAVAAAFPSVFFGVVLAAAVGIGGSVSRLAFDAIVQRSLAHDDFGAAFARYETRFQLAWVLGALLPTAVSLPRSLGFAIVCASMIFGLIVGLVGEPALDWIGVKLRWVTGQLRHVVGRFGFRNQRTNKVSKPQKKRVIASSSGRVLDRQVDTHLAAHQDVPNTEEASQSIPVWKLPGTSTISRRRSRK